MVDLFFFFVVVKLVFFFFSYLYSVLIKYFERRTLSHSTCGRKKKIIIYLYTYIYIIRIYIYRIKKCCLRWPLYARVCVCIYCYYIHKYIISFHDSSSPDGQHKSWTYLFLTRVEYLRRARWVGDRWGGGTGRSEGERGGSGGHTCGKTVRRRCH